MKKFFALVVVAMCMIACNSVDQKLDNLDKACEDKNLEKAEKICASIDAAKLNAEQSARLTKATVKMSALKAEQFLKDAGETVKEAVEEAGEAVQQAIEDVSEETKQAMDNAAKKAIE